MTAVTHKQTARRRRRGTPYRFIGYGLWLRLALLAGCGGQTQRPASETYLDAVFARIQVHEAELQRAQASAEGATTETEHTRARQQAREAADAICELATRAKDRDGLQRCDLARATLSSVRPFRKTTDVELD